MSERCSDGCGANIRAQCRSGGRVAVAAIAFCSDLAQAWRFWCVKLSAKCFAVQVRGGARCRSAMEGCSSQSSSYWRVTATAAVGMVMEGDDEN